MTRCGVCGQTLRSLATNPRPHPGHFSARSICKQVRTFGSPAPRQAALKMNPIPGVSGSKSGAWEAQTPLRPGNYRNYFTSIIFFVAVNSLPIFTV